MENGTENVLVEDLTVIYVFQNNICSPDKFITQCVTKLHISVCLYQNYMLVHIWRALF